MWGSTFWVGQAFSFQGLFSGQVHVSIMLMVAVALDYELYVLHMLAWEAKGVLANGQVSLGLVPHCRTHNLELFLRSTSYTVPTNPLKKLANCRLPKT